MIWEAIAGKFERPLEVLPRQLGDLGPSRNTSVQFQFIEVRLKRFLYQFPAILQ